MQNGAFRRSLESLSQRAFGLSRSLLRAVNVGEVCMGRHERRLERDCRLQLLFGFAEIAAPRLEAAAIHAALRAIGVVALTVDVFRRGAIECGTLLASRR